LRYQVIMDVMDQIKRSGVPTVGLVTEPRKQAKR